MKTTTVNRVFLFGLFVCIAISIVAVHGLHAFQVNRQSSFLLEEAHRARTAKLLQVAVSRLQQYTKLAPDDIDAQAELGLLLADLHASRAAAVTLEKVLRGQPERDDLRRRLVQVEMEIYRYPDAEDHLLYLLKKSPQDSSLLERLGTCQEAGGRYPAAVKSLRDAIQYDPQQLEAYVHLADVLRKRQYRPREADECMDALVQANPNSGRAHLLLGQYLEMFGQAEAALGQAEVALKLDPKDAEALVLAARLRRDKAEYDKAREYAQRAIDSSPNQVTGYVTLASVELRHGDRKKAFACLEAGVEKTGPKNETLLLELGRMQIEAGELDKAQAIVDQLHKLPADDPSAPFVVYLEAQLEMAHDRWQQAIQCFEQITPRVTNSPDLLKQIYFQVAACHEKLGNTELQLAAYREASSIDSTWMPARLGVANTLFSLGRLDEALEEYRQIRKLDGTSGAAAVGEARLLILKNLEPGTGEKKWEEVDQILDQLAHDNPDSVDVVLLQAESLVAQRRPKKAETLLLAARSKSPDQNEIWTALVGLAEREQQWDRAEQVLDEADKKFGDRVWLRLNRGLYLLERFKQESPPKLKALADTTDAFSVADRVELASGMAALAYEAGDMAQAARLARRACDADPKRLETRIFRFELAILGRDAATGQQVLKEIHDLEKIEGGGPFWHYGQAALELLSIPTTGQPNTAALQNLNAALQHLGEARKQRPGWARVPLLTARVWDRKDQDEAALKYYLEAVDLGERGSGAIHRTFQLLIARQRYAEADQLLRRLEQRPNLVSSDVKRMVSQVSARLENLDRALEIALKAAADSQDWRDHLWLGQLQRMVGQRAKMAQQLDEANKSFAEAEKSLRFAVRLKPEVREVWIALFRFYWATDRKSEAETTIQQLKRALPAETVPLALAACYEAVGDAAEAAKYYRSELAKHGQDPAVVRRAAEFSIRSGQLNDAEIQLLSIVSGQVAAKPSDVLWARRALASVLRASGNYSKLQEALALLEQNLAADSSPEDQKEKAFVLAACPQLERRREAIRILEKLASSQPDAADVLLALSQLYLGERDWPQASKQLRRLVSDHNQDPRYLAVYVAQLLEHQGTAEAEPLIRRLEQLAPDEFSTAGLKAEAFVKHQQIDQAIQIMRDYLAQPGLQGTGRIAQTHLAAMSLEALSRSITEPGQATAAAKLLAEAEGLFRENAKQQPDERLVLAAFLARRRRFDEALTVAESAWPTVDAEVISLACNELLGSGLAESGETNRFEKLLFAAVDNHHRAAPLLLSLADLRTRQERFDDAVAIYREVLQTDSSNLVAMNNLAMLLALQKKQPDESQRLIEKAIATAGPLPALLDSRAVVFLAIGQPRKALTDLDEAIGAEPRPNRQFHRALAYMQLGQEQAAAQSLDDARKLGLAPENLNALERPSYQQLVVKLKR